MKAKGPKGQARERGRRARAARPGGERAGVSLPGRWWSILQRVGVGVGRPCSAVTSGAARRWPRSLELTNLPCPGLAEEAGATRASPPTSARQPSVLRSLFRFVVLRRSSCACLPVSRCPLGNGRFPGLPGGPSGPRATSLPEARVKQLPRRAWRGRAVRS